MKISVVIPLYNEESLVRELIERVGAAIEAVPEPSEILIVDDGSTDNTLAVLVSEQEKNSRIKIISLSRNFGLQAAIHAGIEHASGESIIVMDGDFQDPPELIPLLVGKLNDGDLDIVIGRRSSRKERWPKRVFIRWFHNIMEPRSAEGKLYDTGNFCILKRPAAVGILNAGEKQRYFPGLRSYVGFKVDYIDYERIDRSDGKPKMTYRKLFSLAADSLFAFSKWPLRLCFIAGIISLFVFVLAIIYTLLSKKLGLAPLGWSSTFISIYLFGSLQLTFLGVLGEYIFRVYKEVQNRPLYIIRKVYDSRQQDL
ncbi:MAG: glycosyltransferase family 2 protein [Bacteroidales bacterium]|nr:glycosyltransferase family 2 protein [Bacteroidales bacterium]